MSKSIFAHSCGPTQGPLGRGWDMRRSARLLGAGLLALTTAGCDNGPTECSKYAAALADCVETFNAEGSGGLVLSYTEPECPAKGQEGRVDAEIYACYAEAYTDSTCDSANELTQIAVAVAACGIDPSGGGAGGDDNGGGSDTGSLFDSGSIRP